MSHSLLLFAHLDLLEPRYFMIWQGLKPSSGYFLTLEILILSSELGIWLQSWSLGIGSRTVPPGRTARLCVALGKPQSPRSASRRREEQTTSECSIAQKAWKGFPQEGIDLTACSYDSLSAS